MDFLVSLRLGMQHFLHIDSVEHINFVVALCAIFLMKDWRKVLILAGAFALGHSITLWVASFEVLHFKDKLINFLIPVSVIVTAFINLFKQPYSVVHNNLQTNYFMAFFFGMVHGVSLSNYLVSSVMEPGVLQIAGYNAGLEIGQLVIIGIYLLATFLFVNLFGVTRRDWNLIISAALIGINYMIMLENKIW